MSNAETLQETETMTNTECPICGSSPVGEGCYHQCPNSTHYYSPEQERYDDEMSVFNRDHITEAYAATALDPEYELWCADQDAAEREARDSACCDCGVLLPDPEQRHLINGGALCERCYIAREAETERSTDAGYEERILDAQVAAAEPSDFDPE